MESRERRDWYRRWHCWLAYNVSYNSWLRVEEERGELTFPGAANDLGAQTDSAIVLAVGIDAHLGRKDAGLEHVLHLAVGVYIAGKYLKIKRY